jgi:hypothetical protein
MGEHRFFAGRPKSGAFPDRLPAAHIRDVGGARWKFRLCEYARTQFPALCLKSTSTAYIVRAVYFIDTHG